MAERKQNIKRLKHLKDLLFSRHQGNVRDIILLTKNLVFQAVWEHIYVNRHETKKHTKQRNVLPEQIQTFASWTNSTEATEFGAQK